MHRGKSIPFPSKCIKYTGSNAEKMESTKPVRELDLQ